MRVALIGFGQAAEQVHVPALARVDGVELVAACDTEADRRALARRLGISRVHQEVEPMLREERPDVVIVATPPDRHFGHCRHGLEAGAHVFCEKPFVPSLDEADELIDLARRSGLHLRINSQYRYMKIYRETRRRIEAGELGRPFFLQCWQQMFHPPERESNWRARLPRYTLFEFGPHVLDLATYLLGTMPESVHAVIPEVPHGVDSDVLVQLTLRFPGGQLATVALNRVSRAPERYLEMRLDCERASVRLSFGGVARIGLDWRRRLRRPGFRFSLVRGGEARVEENGRSRVIARQWRSPLAPATAAHFRRFVEQIAGGAGEDSTAQAEHSREILAVVLAAYESAERGGIVPLR